jgi:hypothetical protein
MENNLRESDRRWGGFLEKEERDISIGLGFFIWRMKVLSNFEIGNCLPCEVIFFAIYTYTN